MTNEERYTRAAHAMQTGVAFEMPSKETEPKHLRVGINAAMSDQAGLVRLLIEKGLFTLEEYKKAIADQMEVKAESYRLRLKQRTGKNITLF